MSATGDSVELRRNRATDPGDASEMYADAFAEALLMPEREVRLAGRLGWGWIEMMVYFGVTQEDMIRRLRNLGVPVR